LREELFGLGSATQVDTPEVIWSGENRQTLTGLRANTTVEVRER